MNPATTYLAPSHLYALSQGSCNHGTDPNVRCHWCGEPCTRELLHDGPPRLPFIRKPPTPLERVFDQGVVPSSLHCCHGCWLWRRPSVTVWFLGGKELRDRQAAPQHSWWVTEEGAWALRRIDLPALWPLLLKPPCRFLLSLREELYKGNGEEPGPRKDKRPCELNHLQCCVVNDNPNIDAQTELYFTLGNVRFAYTIYELEQGVRHGGEGKSAGVRELLRLFDGKLEQYETELGDDPQLRYSGMGHPTNSATRAARKLITHNGLTSGSESVV